MNASMCVIIVYFVVVTSNCSYFYCVWVNDVTHEWNVVEKGVHTVPRDTTDTAEHHSPRVCVANHIWFAKQTEQNSQ